VTAVGSWEEITVTSIYRLLDRDHREIATLLAQVGTSPDDADFDAIARRRLLDRLIFVASRHEASEELVFWRAVRKNVGEGDDLSRIGLEQEQEAKYVLDAIRFTSSEAELLPLCHQLADLVERHATFEEDRVWPALRRATTMVEAFIWGVEYSLAQKTAPTRPHPRGPNRPFGLLTKGALISTVDRLRDKVSRRHPIPAPTEAHLWVDAINLLSGDHAAIEHLLTQAEQPTGRDADLVNQIVRELSVHDSIERAHLYPMMRRRLEGGNDLYPRWITEHGEIATLLAEIDRRASLDSDRDELLDKLIPLVRAHIAEEEGTAFPALRVRMADAELAELGRTLVEAKSKAPTRPHSHVTGAGLGARLSRAFAAPLDKTRDALAGRR
jgi:hemerythrin superfamily protein